MATFAPFYDTLRFYASALYWETEEEVSQRETDEQAEVKQSLPQTHAEQVRHPSVNLRPILYFPLRLSSASSAGLAWRRLDFSFCFSFWNFPTLRSGTGCG